MSSRRQELKRSLPSSSHFHRAIFRWSPQQVTFKNYFYSNPALYLSTPELFKKRAIEETQSEPSSPVQPGKPQKRTYVWKLQPQMVFFSSRFGFHTILLNKWTMYIATQNAVYLEAARFLCLEGKLARGIEHLALGGAGGLGAELVGVQLTAESAGLLGAKVNWLVLLTLNKCLSFCS